MDDVQYADEVSSCRRPPSEWLGAPVTPLLRFPLPPLPQPGWMSQDAFLLLNLSSALVWREQPGNMYLRSP